MSESDTNVASRLGIDPVVDRDLEGAHDGLELAERQSLRRVAGLRTELEDITEVEYRQLRLERVVLVGVWTEGSAEDAENSLAELKLLAETAGSDVLDALLQRRQRPDPATFIGSGKVEELTAAVQATGADTIICDGELAPSQLRNLEDRTKVKVVDRTALILDIFAQHAKSAEGKAQVELAQLQYQTQRLRGWGGNLSRQAGGRAAGGEGIGGRGPGETKLETDRRRIQSRMAKLRRELTALRTTRDIKKARRRRNEVPAVVIAGYTNAGKSSLLNRLTGAGVLVEDALFATLDPTTRKTQTSDGRVFTMSDTVGFVRHLPHQLVEAFRSTLEEVAEADLVLHVVDASHPDPAGQIAAVREVFAEIEALHSRTPSSSAPVRARASTSCSPPSRPTCPDPRCASRSWCPTSAVTSSTRCTRPARSRSWRTSPTAPTSSPASPTTSPTSSTPSDHAPSGASAGRVAEGFAGRVPPRAPARGGVSRPLHAHAGGWPALIHCRVVSIRRDFASSSLLLDQRNVSLVE